MMTSGARVRRIKASDSWAYLVLGVPHTHFKGSCKELLQEWLCDGEGSNGLNA